MAHRNNDWSTGMFGCFEDFGSCIVTCFFPCITLGQNKAMLDGREASCCDYCCAMSENPTAAEYFTRQHIRNKYGFANDNCGDCCALVFCPACVICQHHRELRNRRNMVPPPSYTPVVVTNTYAPNTYPPNTYQQ